VTSRRIGTVSRAAMMAFALILTACGGSEPAGTPQRAAAPSATAFGAPAERPRGVVADCSMRSMASFPGAFSDPRNLVVDPLVLVGAGYTPASVVREFGGNKFPLLVRAGHRVTVELSRRTRRVAGLAYGPLPQGELHLRDAHRVVTFRACRRGERSGSDAGGWPVTFWSGFVLARAPGCVPLRVWVDGAPAPRLATLRLGARRCP
jgi:hypothetical protein